MFKGRPKFLGYVLQGFRTYGDFISREPAAFIPQIEKAIRDDLVSVLPDELSVRRSTAGYRIGQVKHLGAIVTSAQTQGTPMASVRGGSPTLKSEAHAAFRYIAHKVAERIAKE